MIRARALAEATLEWSGITRWAAQRRRGRTLVLAYHNIVPDDVDAGGDRSLHLPRGRFAQQLDALTEYCDVVPLTAVLTDPPATARPRVAITFDDAYHGALTLGAAELKGRQLPATMFVPPGLLGGQSFWWDALAGLTGLSVGVRAHALDVLRGDGDAVFEWANRSGHAIREVSSWERSGTESELEAWAGTPSLTVGAHTWRHRNLVRLTESEVREELDSTARVAAKSPRWGRRPVADVPLWALIACRCPRRAGCGLRRGARGRRRLDRPAKRRRLCASPPQRPTECHNPRLSPAIGGARRQGCCVGATAPSWQPAASGVSSWSIVCYHRELP